MATQFVSFVGDSQSSSFRPEVAVANATVAFNQYLAEHPTATVSSYRTEFFSTTYVITAIVNEGA